MAAESVMYRLHDDFRGFLLHRRQCGRSKPLYGLVTNTVWYHPGRRALKAATALTPKGAEDDAQTALPEGSSLRDRALSLPKDCLTFCITLSYLSRHFCDFVLILFFKFTNCPGKIQI